MMHAVLRLLAGLLAHDSSNFSDTWPPNMTTELGGQVENAGGASSSQAPRCQIPGARLGQIKMRRNNGMGFGDAEPSRVSMTTRRNNDNKK